MAKMTLLEMTRNILSALDEDDVDNIDDTPSSVQVAEVIKEIYYQFIENDRVPELERLIRLSAAPAAEVALLTLPANLARLDYIKYNVIRAGETRPVWKEICYLEPQEFLRRTDGRDLDLSNIVEMTDPTSTNVTLYIQNDKAPDYWTSFDDLHVIFDSYDIAVDAAGLSAAKTKCFGQIVPTWTASNAFTPALDANKFAYLLAEAKATCFSNLNKEPNTKTELQVRQQKAKQQNNLYRYSKDDYKTRQPNFGRR